MYWLRNSCCLCVALCSPHLALCRIRFDYSDCLVGPSNTQVLEHAIAELAKRYQMDWRMFYDSKVKRVAILVSKLDHCLYDLLIRLKAGELNCQVPVIISNHPDLAPIAQQFGVAFRYRVCTDCCSHLVDECYWQTPQVDLTTWCLSLQHVCSILHDGLDQRLQLAGQLQSIFRSCG